MSYFFFFFEIKIELEGDGKKKKRLTIWRNVGFGEDSIFITINILTFAHSITHLF